MAEIEDVELESLRAQAAEVETYKTQLEEGQKALAEGARKEAFREAGFADHPARELLEKVYEVGMTPEQLRETAEKFGIAPAHQPDGDLAALRRVNAAGGAPASSGLPEFGDAINNAGSLRQLEAILHEGGEAAGIQWRGKTI